MYITKEFIQQIKTKANMVELASEYTDLNKVGDGVWGGICPNPHHHDKDPSFTVFEKDDSWCCYGCHHGNKFYGKTHQNTNYGSDCIAFMQWVSGGKLSWKEAVFQLAKRYRIPMPEQKYAQLYEANQDRANAFQINLTKRAKQYLYDRGLDDEDIKAYQLGFDGKKIVFPLKDIYNRTVGFTKRWIDPPEGCRDKYRNSKTDDIFNKSYYLYGMKDIDKEYDYLYITEGPFDQIFGSKYGLKNVLATLGTSFTDGHADIVKNSGKIPVFVMDGDSAGLKSTEKCIEKMASVGVYSMLVILDNGYDLADTALLYKEDLVEYIESKQMTYGFYKTQTLMIQYQNMLIQSKLKILPELKQVVQTIPEVEKQSILDFIKETANITVLEKGDDYGV